MPPKKVKLETALIAGSTLRSHIKRGLRALINNDLRLIVPAIRTYVGDSLNLDDTIRAEFPQDNRWDYLLSVPRINQIIGLEPHSAKDSEVSVIIAKRKHAIEYLRNHLHPQYIVSKWFWVSHGRVNFSKMESAIRLLNKNGIEFKGRRLNSFD